MKRKENTVESQLKSGSITTLVEEYTDQLIAQESPDPQQFLNKYSNNTKREELKAHINIATLLTTQGVAQKKIAKKIMKDKKRIEKSKRKLLVILSKKGGGAR